MSKGKWQDIQHHYLIVIEKDGVSMKLLPEKESIYLLSKGGFDDWGLPTTSEEKELIKCYIKASQTSTGLQDTGGKQVLPTYDISFNGAVAIKVGDLIEIEGETKEVLKRIEIKDLSRKVLVTKVTV